MHHTQRYNARMPTNISYNTNGNISLCEMAAPMAHSNPKYYSMFADSNPSPSQFTIKLSEMACFQIIQIMCFPIILINKFKHIHT